MKCHVAYAHSPARDGRKALLTMVFSRSHDQAEIEKDRMKFSDAKTVGLSARAERPRKFAQHLLHKYSGSDYTIRHIPGR